MQLWSLEMAANQLGISVVTLRAAIKRGELTSFCLGGRYYIDDDSLGAYLESRRNVKSPVGRKKHDTE